MSKDAIIVHRHIEQRSEVAKEQEGNEPQQKDQQRALVEIDEQASQHQADVQVDGHLPCPEHGIKLANAFKEILLRTAIQRVAQEAEEDEPGHVLAEGLGTFANEQRLIAFENDG